MVKAVEASKKLVEAETKVGGSSGSGNTGGGGGGAGNSYVPYSGAYLSAGSGGSGVVVLKLPTANYTGQTSGSPQVSTSGQQTILRYTGSGTLAV